MILFVSAEGDDAGLLAELKRGGPSAGRLESPGLVALDADPAEDYLPVLALARQTLPQAERTTAASVSAWARAIVERVRAEVAEDQPWRLHVVPHYGQRTPEKVGARALHSERLRGEVKRERPTVATGAGENRCKLIDAAVRELLKERRRPLLRSLVDAPSPLQPADSVVQALLTSPDQGWLSVARAPQPHAWRRLMSPFRAGEIEVPPDPSAPSRAFAKLVEAQLRLGREISAGETCVDLGASPGGWTHVALRQGARVTAVDRSPLRDDLMPRVTFVKGDAFAYQAEGVVDWLLCDVIAPPERSIAMLLDWLARGAMRWFVVTIKLKGDDHAKLDRLKRELPELADDWYLTHLSANKGEACVFGRSSAPRS